MRVLDLVWYQIAAYSRVSYYKKKALDQKKYILIVEYIFFFCKDWWVDSFVFLSRWSILIDKFEKLRVYFLSSFVIETVFIEGFF